MEHHWDESFGYFGAARDYNTGYSDDNARKTTQNDSNGDGSIDFKTEFNSGWGITAAKETWLMELVLTMILQELS